MESGSDVELEPKLPGWEELELKVLDESKESEDMGLKELKLALVLDTFGLDDLEQDQEGLEGLEGLELVLRPAPPPPHRARPYETLTNTSPLAC